MRVPQLNELMQSNALSLVCFEASGLYSGLDLGSDSGLDLGSDSGLWFRGEDLGGLMDYTTSSDIMRCPSFLLGI